MNKIKFYKIILILFCLSFISCGPLDAEKDASGDAGKNASSDNNVVIDDSSDNNPSPSIDDSSDNNVKSGYRVSAVIYDDGNHSTVNYNTDGMVSSIIYSDATGIINTWNYSYNNNKLIKRDNDQLYGYNNEGQLIQFTELYLFNGVPYSTDDTFFFYNSLGQVTSTDRTNLFVSPTDGAMSMSEYYQKFQYNGEKLIQVIEKSLSYNGLSYNGNDSTLDFQYDDENRLTRLVKSYFFSGPPTTDVTYLTYDNQGRLVETRRVRPEQIYDDEGIFIEVRLVAVTTTIQYNSNGLYSNVRVSSTEPGSRHNSNTSYQYEKGICNEDNKLQVTNLESRKNTRVFDEGLCGNIFKIWQDYIDNSISIDDSSDNNVVIDDSSDNDVVIDDSSDNIDNVVIDDSSDNNVVIDDSSDNNVVIDDSSDNNPSPSIDDSSDNNVKSGYRLSAVVYDTGHSTVNYDADGMVSSAIVRDATGVIATLNYSYNNNKLIREYSEFNNQLYKYNNEGQLIQSTLLFLSNGVPSSTEDIFFFYNSLGQVTSTDTTNLYLYNDGTISESKSYQKFQYNGEKLIQIIVKSSSTYNDSILDFQYDNENRLTRLVKSYPFFRTGAITTDVVDLKYDNQGRLVETRGVSPEAIYDDGGTFIEVRSVYVTTTIQYNSNGLYSNVRVNSTEDPRYNSNISYQYENGICNQDNKEQVTSLESVTSSFANRVFFSDVCGNISRIWRDYY